MDELDASHHLKQFYGWMAYGSHAGGRGVELIGIGLCIRPFTDRLTRRASRRVDRRSSLVDRVHQNRRTARSRGHERDARGRAPDVPAVGEFVSGYEVSAWYGMGAPTGTAPEVIHKINKEINAGLADANWR
jgi:tripartite-type tricarboxylate transporter receptor subunit TctC